MIKIEFEITSVHGLYRDALYLSEDNRLTVEEIEQIKLDRFNTWINLIENPVNTISEMQNGE